MYYVPATYVPVKVWKGYKYLNTIYMRGTRISILKSVGAKQETLDKPKQSLRIKIICNEIYLQLTFYRRS